MAARRINLLPAEIAAVRRARQRKIALVAAAGGVIVLLVGVYLFTLLRLNNERDRLEETNARVAALRSQVAALKDFEDLSKEVEAKTQLIDDLTAQEVRWSVLMADASLVLPSDTWLTTFSGTVAATTQGAASSGPLGTIQINGVTFTHPDVANWLSRLATVDEFTFPYLSLSAKATIDETAVVTFNSSVELSEDAFRRNQPGARRKLQ